jgi:hypothetical protein
MAAAPDTTSTNTASRPSEPTGPVAAARPVHRGTQHRSVPGTRQPRRTRHPGTTS